MADCPLTYTSPNAPEKRDVLGTTMLSVLAGHKRYAHITALRNDGVLPELLGMKKIVSEDAVRRGFKAIGEVEGREWLQRHLDYCTAPLLSELWVLDMDSTVKPLYGHQEGAVLGYNPKKPGLAEPRLPYRCRPGLAGTGGQAAAGGLEPSAPGGHPAPPAEGGHGHRRMRRREPTGA